MIYAFTYMISIKNKINLGSQGYAQVYKIK